MTDPKQIRVRRDTAAHWAGVVPAEGEPTYETDTKRQRIGDGMTQQSQLDAAAWVDGETNLFASPVREALAATFGDPSTPEGAAVAAALTAAAADVDAVAAAAAAAVQGQLANQYVAYTLPYGLAPQLQTATTEPSGSQPVAFGSPAKFTSAMSGGRLKLPNVPTLRGSGKSFTLEMWAFALAVPGGRVVLATIGDAGSGCYIFVDSGTGKVGWNFPGQTAALSPSSICDGTWHHIALQWTEGTNLSMTIDALYVDGVAVSGYPVVSTQNHPSVVTIGGLTSTPGYDFGGSIDEVRFSSSSRYSGSFSAPGMFTWDSNTLDLAHMESAAVQTGTTGTYPVRPTAAAAGAVTYVGPIAPTDALTYDKWVKTA
jgi:hypothetical protein